jgi:hypothetical protein
MATAAATQATERRLRIELGAELSGKVTSELDELGPVGSRDLHEAQNALLGGLTRPQTEQTMTLAVSLIARVRPRRPYATMGRVTRDGRMAS